MSAVAAALLAIACFGVRPCAAEITAAQLADALDAAEAQFATLNVRYTIIQRVDPGMYGGSCRAEVLHLYSAAQKKELIDWRVYPVDSDPSDPTVLRTADDLYAFDGEISYHLDRMPRKDGMMNAAIFGGEQRRSFFPLLFATPRDLVWASNAKSRYSDYLRAYPTWVIEEHNKDLPGIEAIKASSTIGDEYKLTVTIWVAPEKAFLPVRFRFAPHAGNPEDREYGAFQKLEGDLWFPGFIHRKWDKGGEYRYEIRSVSTKIEDESIFHPRPPPNTYVSDTINDRAFKTPPPVTQPAAGGEKGRMPAP
jgi:hypothetical protein